jgi:hypothetical protein
MKRAVFLFLLTTISLISLTGCIKDCDCTENQMTIFLDELERHHSIEARKEDIICKEHDGIWFVKQENVLDWLFILQDEHFEKGKSIAVYKTPIRETKYLKPFINYVQQQGYSIRSIKKNEERTFIFKFENKGEYYNITQEYLFSEDGHWKKTANRYDYSISKLDFSK